MHELAHIHSSYTNKVHGIFYNEPSLSRVSDQVCELSMRFMKPDHIPGLHGHSGCYISEGNLLL